MWVIQIKSKIKIKPNQNDLNVTLEPTVFEMDAVIVSTAFNKIQSQNVMKVEHKTIKELQQKGQQPNKFLAFLKFLLESIETSNTWVETSISHREFEWRTNSLATNMVWV
jgi:hypothetical protein